MQSENEKFYYCFPCQKTISVRLPDLICPECSSDFLQEANIPDIEPMVPRELFLMDIVSIFAETSDPVARRNRILSRINQQESGESSSRSFRFVLTELLERSGRSVPASSERIQNITTVIIEKQEDNECKICAEVFQVGDEKKILKCHHDFHSSCLEPWLKLKNICPACRQSI